MGDPTVQLVDLPIQGGESQNQDERAGDNLQRAENVTYHRRGGLEPRLGQEPLATVTHEFWDPPGGKDLALVKNGEQLAVIAGGVVRALTEDVGSPPANVLSSIGLASAYDIERLNIDGASQTQRGYQFCEGGGFRFFWLVTSGDQDVFMRLVDIKTGAPIFEATKTIFAAAAGSTKYAAGCCYQNGLFFGWFTIGTSLPYFVALNPQTGVVTLIGTVDGGGGGTAFACIPHPNGTHLILASPAGTPPAANLHLTIVTATTSPAITGTLDFSLSGSSEFVTSIALDCSDPARCWIVVGDGADRGPTHVAPVPVRVLVARANVTNVAAPTSALAMTAIYSETEDQPNPGGCYVAYCSIKDKPGGGAYVAFTPTGWQSSDLAQSFRPYTPLEIINDAGAVQTFSVAYGCQLTSHVWLDEAQATAYCTVQQTARYMAQPGVGVVPPLGCMHVVAFRRGLNAAYYAALGSTAPFPCQIHSTFGVLVTPTSDIFATGASNRDLEQTRYNSAPCNALVQEDGSVLTLAFALERADVAAHCYIAIAHPTRARQHVQLAGRTFITAGVPALWDGRSVTEWGFMHGPRLALPATYTAGAILTGAYQWRATYEWIDANGCVMRGPVNNIADTDSATAFQAAFAITCDQLSYKNERTGTMGRDGSKTFIALYRTAADQSALHYRLTPPEIRDLGAGSATSIYITSYGRLYPTDLSATPRIVDNYPDTGGARGDIFSFPTLYTDGGAYQASPVPSCTMVVVWQNRITLAGTDDDSIWISTEDEGGEIPYFSPAVRIAPFGAARTTGLAVLDDKLIVFKPTAIYVFAGLLPNKTGSSGSIPTPTTVATDAGCIDPLSVVVMPDGVMFRSQRGIYLLSRGLDLGFVGENVALDVERAGTIQAPLLVPKQSQVRFDAPIGGSELAGPTLYFDYLMKAWTRGLFDEATVDEGRVPFAQAVRPNGRVYWLDGNGALWRERVKGYADATATHPIFYRLQTAWFHPAGLQGYLQLIKVYVLGAWGFPHRLRVRTFVDFNESVPVCEAVHDVPANPPAGYELESSIAYVYTSRVQAVSFELVFEWDTVSATPVDAMPAAISGIALEFVPIGGAMKRLPKGQKA